MYDESQLQQLAAAILDRTPVDWAAVASDAGDESTRRVLRELEVIAGIAGVHGRECLPSAGGLPAPEEPYVGTWGPLRLIEKIGEGAYGEVFRAWDMRLDREVALKLLPTDLADGSSSSIIEEGRLLARVRHPNVVTIYGADQFDDRIGLWMELVRGRSLEAALKEQGPFSAVDTVRIGLEVCRAVAAVHRSGLLHRDIKAHNVMLTEEGRVVLMDFGAGREIADATGPSLVGTPLYLAPEILAGQPATVQTEIYGLGVLLFHLLTGTYPAISVSASGLRQVHEREQYVGVRTARHDAPSSLARIIERAIHRDPAHRYARVDDLAAALQSWASSPLRRYAVLAASAAVTLGLVWVLAFSSSDRPRGSAAEPTEPAGTPTAGAASISARPPVIAVLPFRSVGGGDGSEEFSDGLTYEILRNLSTVKGLQTRAATSSFTFKDQEIDVIAAGSELGADYVLDGSIFRADFTVRVYPRLTHVADGTTVWVDKFERDHARTFEIQDEISLAVVGALRLKIDRGRRRYETRPDLYVQYLRGVGLRAKRHPDNAGKAADLFQAVVEADPEFVPAWAALASATADATRFNAGDRTPPVDPRMEPAARKALALDAGMAEAHAAMGSVHARNRDWTSAIKEFDTALDIDPSLTTTHTDFVLSTLLPLGHREEALAHLEAAREADPKSLDVRRVLALLQVDTGRYEQAIESARWVLSRDPNFPYADIWLARALVLSGRAHEALPLYERNPSAWAYRGYLYAVTGRRDEAEALAASHADDPWRVMLIYGGLADRDRAFDALEKTAATHWWGAATWMLRPELAILRDDPRLADLRSRLGLPPLDSLR